MNTIRHYTDDFKRDAIRYVESHPGMTMKDYAYQNNNMPVRDFSANGHKF